MNRTRPVTFAIVLAILSACTGRSDPVSTEATRSPSASVADAATPLEGAWRGVVTVRGMRETGFTESQIRADKKHEGWTSRYDLGLSVTGDTWVLTEAADGQTPVVGAHGSLSVSGDKVRLTDETPPLPACTVVLNFRARDDELAMTFIDADCDENPLEPIPDFMYAAVLVQPFQRVD